MPPATDYVRHAARLARKYQLEAQLGTPVTPDADYWKTLAKALEEIASGLEQIRTRD